MTNPIPAAPSAAPTDERIDAICAPGRADRWKNDGRQYDRDTVRLVLAALAPSAEARNDLAEWLKDHTDHWVGRRLEKLNEVLAVLTAAASAEAMPEGARESDTVLDILTAFRTIDDPEQRTEAVKRALHRFKPAATPAGPLAQVAVGEWTLIAPDGWQNSGAKPIELILAASKHQREIDPAEALKQDARLMTAIEDEMAEHRADRAELVNRFLRWPLPRSVFTDAGTGTVAPSKRPENWSATGTNLLTANEAGEMLAFVLDCDEADRELAHRTIQAAAPSPQVAPGEPDTATDYARIGLLEWAVSKWRNEVQNRPLVNVHRRTLDDTWRQVIRHAGGDPDDLVGPSHDALVSGGEQHGR